MNNRNATIIAQTVNSRVIKDLGLVPNMAAYRITRIDAPGSQTPMYQVYSSLPCHYVGSHSAVYNTPLNKIYKT